MAGPAVDAAGASPSSSSSSSLASSSSSSSSHPKSFYDLFYDSGRHYYMDVRGKSARETKTAIDERWKKLKEKDEKEGGKGNRVGRKKQMGKWNAKKDELDARTKCFFAFGENNRNEGKGKEKVGTEGDKGQKEEEEEEEGDMGDGDGEGEKEEKGEGSEGALPKQKACYAQDKAREEIVRVTKDINELEQVIEGLRMKGVSGDTISPSLLSLAALKAKLKAAVRVLRKLESGAKAQAKHREKLKKMKIVDPQTGEEVERREGPGQPRVEERGLEGMGSLVMEATRNQSTADPRRRSEVCFLDNYSSRFINI